VLFEGSFAPPPYVKSSSNCCPVNTAYNPRQADLDTCIASMWYVMFLLCICEFSIYMRERVLHGLGVPSLCGFSIYVFSMLFVNACFLYSG
jgi:hypothetical protein